MEKMTRQELLSKYDLDLEAYYLKNCGPKEEDYYDLTRKFYAFLLKHVGFWWSLVIVWVMGGGISLFLGLKVSALAEIAFLFLIGVVPFIWVRRYTEQTKLQLTTYLPLSCGSFNCCCLFYH